MGVRYAYRSLFWTPRIRGWPQATRPPRERGFVSPCHSTGSRTQGEELVMATLPLFEQSAPGGTIHGNAAIIARERQKSLMLRAWILSGLFFMTLPGTLLGFSNLMAISAHHGLAFLPPAWLEGHGHAQMFGWIGSFILGIGFYSQPAREQPAIRLPPACFVRSEERRVG